MNVNFLVFNLSDDIVVSIFNCKSDVLQKHLKLFFWVDVLSLGGLMGCF